MKKELVIVGLMSVLSSQVLASELEAFKKGFAVGLEAVEYQLKHEGFEPKKIKLDNPFVVVLNIENSPTNDILYFQHLLHREGFSSLLTKKYLLLDSFDRLPDAKALSMDVNRKYGISTTIKEFTDGVVETYPILFDKTFEPIFKAVTSNQEKVLVKEYTNPMQIRFEEKQIVKKDLASIPLFTLKNSTMSYRYTYQPNHSNKNTFQSELFYENKIYEKGKKFHQGGIFKTSDGEVFQKVYNSNLFFPIEDVK